MVRLNFDGACQPNPGLAAWGCVVKTDTHTHAGGGPVPGEATNNVAEYAALGNGLKLVIGLGLTGQYVECVGDSQLVVNHVNGVWSCREPRLVACLNRVKQLIAELEAQGNRVGVLWVPREQNHEADRQAATAWGVAAGRPFPCDRVCETCKANVTTFGQANGVLCDAAACPFPKVTWGVPLGRFESPPAEPVRGMSEAEPAVRGGSTGADLPEVPQGVEASPGVGA